MAGTQQYLPVLLDELNAGGIPDERVTIFLATGTHEPHIDNDVAGLLGPGAVGRVRCVPHDCRDENNLERLGTTRAGTPVLFNRNVLHAEVIVLTGRVVPHYFAGYSGGRKALLPGVAGFETILANHRLTLHPEAGLHPAASHVPSRRTRSTSTWWRQQGWPVPHFTLNTLMSHDRRLARAIAGDVSKAHAAIAAEAGARLRLTMPEPVDAVITGPGGAPSDCNFMQSLKALFNVKDLVRPGGAILWVAECPHGIHPGFLEFGSIESDGAMEAEVRASYALTGHNSLMLRNLLRRANVALVSSLPPESVSRLGIEPVASIEEGVRWMQERLRHPFSCAVVPEANVIYAGVREC
nr:hypothetical protein Hi04_10k_c1889_00020 [uncultured bacterium]